MINHARTLLLNRTRSGTHYTDPGYEYIPQDYRPSRLPENLQAIRNVLFGSTPDSYFLNFRAHELLSYIHGTDLRSFIYDLDPRVTYWPSDAAPFFAPASKRVTVTQTYGLPQRLSVAGSLRAIETRGRALNNYVVDLTRQTANNEVQLFISTQYTGARYNNTALPAPTTHEITDIAAPPVTTLDQTTLKMIPNVSSYNLSYNRILTESNDFLVIESYTPEAGGRLLLESEGAGGLTGVAAFTAVLNSTAPGDLLGRWTIETRANPAPALTTVLPTLEMLGEPAFLQLFGLVPQAPYDTFKNLWFDHPLPTYRLAGLVLALIYRTDEYRGKNG